MWYSSPYKILIGAWSIAHITLSHDIHLLGLFVARWYFSTTSSGPCDDRWRCWWHCFSAWCCNKHLRTRQWWTFPNWHWDWFDLQQMEHVKHNNTNKDQKIKSLKMSGQILISCELKPLTQCHPPNIPISYPAGLISKCHLTYPIWIYYNHKCNLLFVNAPNYWVLNPQHRIFCMLPHTTSMSIYSAFNRHILKWKPCTANCYMIGTHCGGSHVLPTAIW